MGVYDAIVLAGGRARRFGGADKPALLVDGVSLLERVLGAVAGAARIVVVGPQRAVPASAAERVSWCRESPPGGGPVAALAAGVPLTDAPTVVVLAADLPWIAPAVAELVAAAEGGPALLVDGAGRVNNLAGAWPRATLVAALATLGEPAGARMGALVESAATTGTLRLIPDPGGWGRDCDTWDDLARAQDIVPARPGEDGG